MLAIERHNHITHILERCGTVRTTEVAKDLGVTDETIRRDLKILEKGDKLYVEGKLRTRKWQDAQGADRTTTEILADNLQMLDRRGDDLSGFAHTPPAATLGVSIVPVNSNPLVKLPLI